MARDLRTQSGQTRPPGTRYRARPGGLVQPQGKRCTMARPGVPITPTGAGIMGDAVGSLAYHLGEAREFLDVRRRLYPPLGE